MTASDTRLSIYQGQEKKSTCLRNSAAHLRTLAKFARSSSRNTTCPPLAASRSSSEIALCARALLRHARYTFAPHCSSTYRCPIYARSGWVRPPMPRATHPSGFLPYAGVAASDEDDFADHARHLLCAPARTRNHSGYRERGNGPEVFPPFPVDHDELVVCASES